MRMNTTRINTSYLTMQNRCSRKGSTNMASIKESIKTIARLDLFALGSMHLANRFISSIALTNNMLKPGAGKYYRWQHGGVFYHKTGTGKPVILLHHLDPSFSSSACSTSPGISFGSPLLVLSPVMIRTSGCLAITSSTRISVISSDRASLGARE